MSFLRDKARKLVERFQGKWKTMRKALSVIADVVTIVELIRALMS